jgi:hypothetical protein
MKWLSAYATVEQSYLQKKGPAISQVALKRFVGRA